MRVVGAEAEVRDALEGASHEALVAFGSGEVYVEKYLEAVRHIEVQVFGDGKKVIHMGERDCSVQRRNQKLVEESPSPGISPKLRDQLTAAACRLAARVGYQSAGTVEFIVDTDTQQFYFIEMNTRIQVEHPVTEEVTGLDLIKEQIRLAAGEPLCLEQEDIRFTGHAIECRINAEDPEAGFMPRPGVIKEFVVPLGPGIRVETHVYPGYVLPPYYDSLLAKVIARGQTREEAIMRMRRALDEFKVSGVPTTIDFHKRLMVEPDFIAGEVHTRFVKEKMWAGHKLQHML
jgi:acetyl-CoA carboxylase biotin carboxylase subunit